MRQVKKQQIKVKVWIRGRRTVYCTTTCNVPKKIKNHCALIYTSLWPAIAVVIAVAAALEELVHGLQVLRVVRPGLLRV